MGNVETERFQQAKDQLVADFRTVVADAEELLRATAGEAGGKASAARAKIEESLRDARRKLAEVEATVTTKARDAAKATDEIVHEHPWKAVGIAAAVGFLLGMLIQRR
ncbi:MAG: DUF883 family protein [Gammaproteobacteria bacterium]|nr:DUF883 family protein [Gammaproteobacteria bacterium]